MLETINIFFFYNIDTYNVTLPEGSVAKITINKTNYKIGDKLVVFLDFTDAQVPCVEVKKNCLHLIVTRIKANACY